MESKLKFGLTGPAAAAGVAPTASVQCVLAQSKTVPEFCATLAKLFGVRPSEIALLRLDHGLLRFVHPEELKTAGAIPVSSSSAIAARTASSRKTEMFNDFSKIKHARVFETVKLVSPDDEEKDQCLIQKLMSAPVLGAGNKVLGVIQVCRKGLDAKSVGPDFSASDLEQLGIAANVAVQIELFQTPGSLPS